MSFDVTAPGQPSRSERIRVGNATVLFKTNRESVTASTIGRPNQASYRVANLAESRPAHNAVLRPIHNARTGARAATVRITRPGPPRQAGRREPPRPSRGDEAPRSPR